MTKYDWPLYGVLSEARIRSPIELRRNLKRLRHRLFPDKSECLVYRGYHLTPEEARFEYQVGSRTYTNRLFLNTYSGEGLRLRDPQAIDTILSNIGMAFIPFMFCLGDFRVIQIDALPLDDEAHAFFTEIIFKSLAEWRYSLGLPVTRPIEIVSTNTSAYQRARSSFPQDRALLLNGGGKDSAVAAELLKRLGLAFSWLTIDANPPRRAAIRISENPDSIELGLEFDPALPGMSLYPQPLPFLILYSFMSLLPAYIEKCRYVYVGNEYSANFGNVKVRGLEVNHQFCKTHEYEAAFERYAKSHILTDVTYLSILRPLYELRIAKLFSNFPQYFGSFVSCNDGYNFWCKSCAKCAFIYLCLSPYLSVEQLRGIFGEDLLDRNVIRSWIVKLTVGGIKPFECVGTREECRLALAMMLAKFPERDFQGWPRRSDLEKCCRDLDSGALRKEFLESFKEPHLLPEALSRQLRRIVDSLS